jgi:formate dehydrogenase iron-sulfur subunit
MAENAILFDASKCIGCKGCQVSCKRWNMLPAKVKLGTWQDLPENERRFTGSYQNPDRLRSDTLLLVTFNEAEDENGLSLLMGRRSCMHCTDAACVQACPVGAAAKHPDGSVCVDHDRCVGCGYCNWACPFGVPKLDSEFKKTYKCRLCGDRVSEGLKPACVSACPTGALEFGEREEMLVIAKGRVAKSTAQGRTLQLYGESEMGGLHVLSLLQTKPSAYGLPENPRIPDTVTAWQAVVKPLGGILGAATVAGLALSYLSNLSYRKEQAQAAPEPPEPVERAKKAAGPEGRETGDD